MLEKIDNGKIVLLEIELEGARQIKKTYPGAFTLFIATPNFDELEKRIRGRATDSPKAIEKRLTRSHEELEAIGEFEKVIINDDFDKALKELDEAINLIF